jgi:hypothetical protein
VKVKVSEVEEVKKEIKTTCNCKKSACLKFYCDCLASGGFCNEECGCVGCFNDEKHLAER